MLEDTSSSIEIAPGRVVPAWLVLGLVLIGQFMVVLDASIVNVALPSIQNDLHFTSSGLQWIVNAYTLTFAGFLLLGGRAADLFGRRKIFLVGLTVFTVASLLGGLAQNQTWLITARAVQGLGAAILAPATLTILTSSFAEGAARTKALAAWSAVSSAGASAGALFGGILTQFLDWRWILFVNVPIGAVALVASLRYVPESRADLHHRHLDLWGAVTVTAGLTAIVFGVVRTETYPWGSSQVLLPIALGVVLIARVPVPPGPGVEGAAGAARHLPVTQRRRWQHRHVADVRGAVRILVLRDVSTCSACSATARSAPAWPSCPRRC